MNQISTLQAPGGASDAPDEELRQLGPWFHNLHLPDGRQTAPDHPLGDFPAFKWAALAPHLPADLSGWRVLDIGCNAGFYSFELARRGADVLAIDHDPHYLAQLTWARRWLDPHGRVQIRYLDVFQLDQLDECFDLVLFLGVFYHLRYPLLALDIAAAKTRGLLVMQTLALLDDAVPPETHDKSMHELAELSAAGWPRMAFVEHAFAGDASNWWIPDANACAAMLRSAGLQIKASPEHGTYVCERQEQASPRARPDGAAGAARRLTR
ncbi:MAG TPA: DUF1698 domain-containing protein [Salinisphaeraceae bacterium]|nr:DUF1698 domain-containing protein [Salinisphaeraceae bacterium]